MNITDIITSVLLKKGVMFEARNVDTDIELPEGGMKVNIKIDHITIKLDKKEEA